MQKIWLKIQIRFSLINSVKYIECNICQRMEVQSNLISHTKSWPLKQKVSRKDYKNRVAQVFEDLKSVTEAKM